MMPIVDAYVCLEQNTYELSDYLEASTQFHVLRMVAQQKAADSGNIAGLLYLQAQAQTRGSGGFPNAIIASMDITEPSEIKVLVEQGGLPNLRAVSHATKPLSNESACMESIELLESAHLCLELDVKTNSLAAVTELALVKSSLDIVVQVADVQVDDDLMDRLGALSQHENVTIKICLPDGSNKERVVGALNNAFNLFGYERILFGSGLKDKRNGQLFDQIWSIYVDACVHLSAKHRDNLFRSNAIRIYGL